MNPYLAFPDIGKIRLEDISMPRQTFSPCEMMLAASTMPLVVGLIALKSLSDAIIGLGQASEEIFRGDRLPVLHLHTGIPANSNGTSNETSDM